VSGLIFGGKVGASLGGVNEEIESPKPYPQLLNTNTPAYLHVASVFGMLFEMQTL
jgi:hypothetical protein